MLDTPSTTTESTATTVIVKRHKPITTTGSILFLIYTLQFRCYCCFSPTSTLARHIQQQPHPQQHCTVHQRKSRKFSTMEDSNIITDRKRSANNDDNDDDDDVFEKPSTTSVDKKRTKLMPTIRNFTKSLPLLDEIPSYLQRKNNAIRNIQLYTNAMLERHQHMIPFTNDAEVPIIIHSLQNVIPTCNNQNDDVKVMSRMLQELQDRILPQFAHFSHKNWTTTGENADQWHSYLFPPSSSLSPNNEDDELQTPQRHMFERIYREGNWDGAVLHRQLQKKIILDNVDDATTTGMKPWAVLVTVRWTG
jgi:hypothetical protein